MNHLLLFYALLAYIASFATSDSLIPGPRNIRKRSPTHGAIANGIEIYSFKIDCKVTSRFAHNVITSRAVNRANYSQEISFEVDIPRTAFITNFSMTIDGVTYPGIIKKKETAQKQYDQAVARGHSAGLVKVTGKKVETFTVSVSVAPKSKVTFELIYEELLQRHMGKYELLLKIRATQLINHFQIEADIFELPGISSLEASGTFMTKGLQQITKTSYSGSKGHVSFKPTLNQQRACKHCTKSRMDGDFTIKYEVNRESPGEVQIVNGYFVHFFAPAKLPSIPKNVVFVLDTSASMSGRKLQQVKHAFYKILENMKEHDYFNLILFDDRARLWKTSIIQATLQNVKSANNFLMQTYEDGWTNINDPLLKAVEMLDNAHDQEMVSKKSVSMIILLTDGRANEGETNPKKIQENVKKAIKGRYTLYALGFGWAVDYPFLEKLALENSGLARRIYEELDEHLQLEGFYDEVANPLLVDVQLKYPDNEISNVTQTNFKNYYGGRDIVVAGRITDNDLNIFTADIKGMGAESAVTFAEKINITEREAAQKQQEYIFGDFTERLWAYLTIDQLLEKRILANGEESDALTDRALELSLKYNFVTPLTSMVVTKPEDDVKDEPLIADKPPEGEYPFYDKIVYGVDWDPHFLVHVPEKNDSLCFNINEEPGVVLNLVQDSYSGITVNGQIIGDKKVSSGKKSSKNTYFGKIGITFKMMGLKIEVTPQNIILRNSTSTTTYPWVDTVCTIQDSLTLLITNMVNLTLSVDDGASFVIILHRLWKMHPLHNYFLGFYVVDSHRFSEKAHGLLGQFFHGVDFDVFDIHNTSDPEKPDATMIVKKHQLTVTRGRQREYRNDPHASSLVPCWFVHSSGKGLIDGVPADYIVPSLFSPM